MSELAAIEKSIKETKEIIKRGQALNRLKKNKDFKNLFLDGYLRDCAAEAVLSKAHPFLQTPKEQAAIDGDIIGIGHFNQYLEMLATSAVTAEASLEEQEETYREIVEEGVE